MNSFKQLEKEVKVLGYYQLIGGIAGIVVIILSMARTAMSATLEPSPLFLMILIGLPFAFSIYAGYLCLSDQSNKLLISKINQVLQVISFSLGGFAFTYHAGVYFTLGIDLTNDFVFEFNLGLSTVDFQINTLSRNSYVLVNIVAFYLVYKILGYEDFIDDQENNVDENIDLADHLISEE